MEEKRRVNVAVDHTEPAFFTDNVTVSHSLSKFVIDFSQTVPRFDNFDNKQQQTFVVKHKTMILDPQFAKVLLSVLQQNLKRYEKNFGEIKLPKLQQQAQEIEHVESTRYIG